MSKVNDIKNLKRQQKVITPTQALAEIVGEEENNITSNEETNKKTKEENKVERKRVSFDLRTDLYKDVKDGNRLFKRRRCTLSLKRL